jgi:hypothetical protein
MAEMVLISRWIKPMARLTPGLRVFCAVLWILGVLSTSVGVLVDLRGWWNALPFTSNLASSLTAALWGIPFAIVVLDDRRKRASIDALERAKIVRLSEVAEDMRLNRKEGHERIIPILFIEEVELTLPDLRHPTTRDNAELINLVEPATRSWRMAGLDGNYCEEAATRLLMEWEQFMTLSQSPETGLAMKNAEFPSLLRDAADACTTLRKLGRNYSWATVLKYITVDTDRQPRFVREWLAMDGADELLEKCLVSARIYANAAMKVVVLAWALQERTT